MTVEEKALALLNEVLVESDWEGISLAMAQARYDYCFDTLCRSIEAHEADKKAFSDAVAGWVKADRKGADARRAASEYLLTFILPEPDPLVEIAREMTLLDGVVRTDNQKAAIREGRAGSTASDEFYDRLRMALPACGYKIERIEQ